MKETDLNGMGPEGFRDAIEYFADNKNEYSKEELYSAFVVVTRLYLDELISARQIENLFVKKYGEGPALILSPLRKALRISEELKAVAASSDTVIKENALAASGEDPCSVIRSQFDIIDRLNGEV